MGGSAVNSITFISILTKFFGVIKLKIGHPEKNPVPFELGTALIKELQGIFEKS